MIHPHRSILVLLLGLALFFLCAGCASKSTDNVETSIDSTQESQPGYPGAVYEVGDEAYPGGYYIHTVKLPDESLSIIAKWFTGDLLNWEVLAKCNPTINPNRIFLGNQIRIPREIMTRQDPMTPEFVMESQPQVKKKPAQTKTTSPAVQTAPEPATEEEPMLFGPKGFTKD
jgi:hypothetical protein